MTFEEAMAVYLYMKDQPPGDRDEKLLRAAWGVICALAVKTIERDRR